MGQIGYFGKNRFEVSGSKVFTPNNIQRSASGRFETFNRIGLKPLTEYVGPGLDTFSFDIKVSATLGVKPRDTLDHWAQLANAGTPDVLVIGNKVLGTDQWILKSAGDTWEEVDGQGKVISATLNLTFEEYVSK